MYKYRTYKMFTYQSKSHPACLQLVRMPSILDGHLDVQAEMNNTWCFIPQWHSHSDCLCHNNVQSDGWITKFCGHILLVCREHSALIKNGHSLVSSTILWTLICPVQLCLVCHVTYWQHNSFILPLQRKHLYTTCNVFTFTWVQRFKKQN
jgi:hypothetical protein